MLSVEEEFNDPALKEAVCKCWSCDCAPAHLKRQIAELFDNGNSTKRLVGRSSWMIWPAALAALLMIYFGLFQHFHPLVKPAFVALPVSLADNLISRHDLCCLDANHHFLKVAKDNDVAIADALRDQLHRPMLVCRPTDDAWLFRGAAICPVGTTPAGHLVFAKGDERLSLFSLPKTLTPEAVEGTEFSSAAGNHCIVAFVKNGALFCLVESGPSGSVNLDQLKQMESLMQPTVTMAPLSHGSRVELAELLQTVSP